MFEYNIKIGDDLISAEQLNNESELGWELVQIIPYVQGSINLAPGQFAHYFRRLKATQ